MAMLPYKPSEVDFSDQWVRYVIIHSTNMDLLLNTGGQLSIDNSIFQTNKLQLINYQHNKKVVTPYNFIVEKVGIDYQIIVDRPLITKTKFKDLDEIYNNKSIHIGILGNLDIDIPSQRLYTVLCFKLIIPLMRIFRLTENKILLHSDITNDTNIKCPGEFFNMAKFKSILRAQTRKRMLAQRY